MHDPTHGRVSAPFRRGLFLLTLMAGSGLTLALAHATPAPSPAPAAPNSTSLWALFTQSFDIFTILLVAGSVVALAVVFSCVMDIRQARILPRRSIERITELSGQNLWDELTEFVARDDSFVGHVVRAALKAAKITGRDGVRDAAELAAAEESARWFRRIELLNVIGNLGPLIGLAGTVWGMILAFTSLGESGGQAGPSDLSQGISKALFHTLLGLMLAIPCLLVFGIYRSVVDRWCTRGTVIAGAVVERIPVVREPIAPITDDTPALHPPQTAEAPRSGKARAR